MLCANNDILMNALESELTDVISMVSQNIVEIIQETIQEEVYDAYNFVRPEIKTRYPRQGMNGGFIGSWAFRLDNPSKYNLSSTIESDPSSMVYDPKSYIHGGRKAGDRRDIMDALIQEGADVDQYDWYVNPGTPNYLGDIDNWWTRPRDYWNPTIDYLENQDGLHDAVLMAFLQLGLDVFTI